MAIRHPKCINDHYGRWQWSGCDCGKNDRITTIWRMPDVIMNTVAGALAGFWERFKRQQHSVFLFHSRFDFYQGKRCAKRWFGCLAGQKEIAAKAVVVATLVARQSIDLGFDYDFQNFMPKLICCCNVSGQEWNRKCGNYHANTSRMHCLKRCFMWKNFIYPNELLDHYNICECIRQYR